MGIHTLDIKALMFRVGQITPLVLSAMLLSACSSTQPKTDDSSAIQDAQPTEIQTAATEEPPAAAPTIAPQLTPENSIELAAGYPREYTVI